MCKHSKMPRNLKHVWSHASLMRNSQQEYMVPCQHLSGIYLLSLIRSHGCFVEHPTTDPGILIMALTLETRIIIYVLGGSLSYKRQGIPQTNWGFLVPKPELSFLPFSFPAVFAAVQKWKDPRVNQCLYTQWQDVLATGHVIGCSVTGMDI